MARTPIRGPLTYLRQPRNSVVMRLKWQKHGIPWFSNYSPTDESAQGEGRMTASYALARAEGSWRLTLLSH